MHFYRQQYEQLSDAERRAIDLAFRDVAASFRALGFQAAMDDRAEVLVEAITHYFVDSKVKGPMP